MLSVDDTSIAKWGKHFDGVGILYDQAKHDGKSYFNGHVFVSLTMSVPILHENAGKQLDPLYRGVDWIRHEQWLDFEADDCLPAHR